MQRGGSPDAFDESTPAGLPLSLRSDTRRSIGMSFCMGGLYVHVLNVMSSPDMLSYWRFSVM